MKDVKKLIGKSKEATQFYQKDVCCTCMTSEEDGPIESENSQVNEKKFSWKEFIKADNFIISLNSEWKTMFDTLIMIVIAYSCFTTLFFIAFDFDLGPVLQAVDWVIIVFFFLDFIFNFLQEYIDEETFARVRKHK